VVVFAMDVIGDGTSERDLRGAWSGGQKPTFRNADVENGTQTDSWLRTQDSCLWIEVLNAIEKTSFYHRTAVQ
jgi:hypothetical protein